jgi:hypothetical protein
MGRRATIGAVVLAVSLTLWARKEETLEELKARAESVSVEDRPGICIRIAEHQLDAADKLFLEGKPSEGNSALADVVSYSEKAGDAATQSGKKLKNTEIAVRKMSRKLHDVKHTVPFEDQGPVQEAIDHLERVRTDLLAKMFGRGGK